MAGRQGAIEELGLGPERTRMVKYARRWSPNDAEGLVNIVLAKAWAARPKDTSRPLSYLWSILRRELRAERRAQQPWVSLTELAETLGCPSSERDLVVQIMVRTATDKANASFLECRREEGVAYSRKQLLHFLDLLPPRLLGYLSVADAARATGISVSSVKRYTSLWKAHFRRHLYGVYAT
jgi:DNA-directed RNA polymerase specialized sigma24 family protein